MFKTNKPKEKNYLKNQKSFVIKFVIVCAIIAIIPYAAKEIGINSAISKAVDTAAEWSEPEIVKPKYQYHPDFIVYPGEIEVINTGGRTILFPDSRTIGGDDRDQKMEVFAIMKDGKKLTFEFGYKSDLRKILPSYSLIDKIAFYVHKDGYPQSFENVKIRNYR